MQLKLKTLLNHVHSFKGFVYQDVRFVRPKGKASVHIVARIVSRKNSTPRCGSCRKPGAGYDHQPERSFMFIQLWGIMMYLLYALRWVNRRDCGVRVEELPWAQGKSPMTTARMCFLTTWKRVKNLTKKQHGRLKGLHRLNLRTVRAYLLKEDFNHLWEYGSPTWAGNFLDRRCDDAIRSRIEPMQRQARTLQSHRELILNYFRARKEFSSGPVEGLNNKAKVVTRRFYGFRETNTLIIALFHTLGHLPEPVQAHRFA